MPIDATTDEQIQACFDVMVQLRPHLVRETFVSTVRAMQSSGYRLAYTEAAGRVVAVAGYRIQTNLAVGRHLYIDDLVTTGGQRSQGAGTELIAWLQDQARSRGCTCVELDSGPQRGRAHKFYFTHGFTIAYYHFHKGLDAGA